MSRPQSQPTSDELPSKDVEFLPPLRPHRRLFVGSLIVLALWAGSLLYIRLTAIEQHRGPVNPTADAVRTTVH